MVVTIRGVNGGKDLSQFVDRQADFEIQASVGSRLDTLHMTLFDDQGILAIPPRAEIVVYDFDNTLLPPGWAGGPPIIDPPPANTTPLFFTWDSGITYDVLPGNSGTTPAYDTQPALMAGDIHNPATWTPRLFAGYVAIANYKIIAAFQREIQIQAQDYTIRNNTTIINKSYAPDGLHPSGWSDQQIIRDLYKTYRPDIDVTYVAQVTKIMPTISFPTHTLKQMLERVIKITAGYFRIDYYKRMYYGVLGTQVAPLSISDLPAPTYKGVVLDDGALVYFRLDEPA